jgi:exodeoxyribonuclease-3
MNLEIEGYHVYLNSAEKKGYAGTLIYSKNEPKNIVFGIDEKYNDEGRVITLEFDDFYFVNAYVPNSQPELKRLDYRSVFEKDVRKYLTKLTKFKQVIYCGDLNVAFKAIDIKNPKANERNPGFSIEERTMFGELLDAGFIDTFRYLYPNKIEYSWWSYRFQARQKNIGWRLDYFLISAGLKSRLRNSTIFTDALGSDHAPICLELDD